MKYISHSNTSCYSYPINLTSQTKIAFFFFFWVAFMDYFILFFLKNLAQNHAALCFGYRKVNDNFAHNRAY